jgi:hypothetical protein
LVSPPIRKLVFAGARFSVLRMSEHSRRRVVESAVAGPPALRCIEYTRNVALMFV